MKIQDMKPAEIKSNIYNIIDNIEDSALLNAVYLFLNKIISKNKSGDFWDSLSEEEKKSIEEGLKDIEEGKVIGHDAVMREIKSRYNF